MASNKKTEARKTDRVAKQRRWLTKFSSDVGKVFDTGDLPSHYVGGGQAFTRGRSRPKPTVAEQLKPHLRRIFNRS